jgi:C4-dicarboxylate transporter DctM subunit
MEWYSIFLILIAGLFLLLLSGLPIAASLGMISFVVLVASVGVKIGFEVIATEVMTLWGSYGLIAIPLFVFMGIFLFAGGIAHQIFDMASKWLRRLPGGLAVVTTGACALFATCSGASIGAVATIGLISVPEMLKRGYNKRLAVGSVAAAGGLAHLIPPSILLILYSGIIEESAGRCLMAGFFPGLVLAVNYTLLIMIWAYIDRKKGVRIQEPSATWKERILALGNVKWPLTIVIVVLGSIYLGIATVTEAAALGAVAALVIAIQSKKVKRKDFADALLDTVNVSGYIMFIALGGKILSWVLTYYNIPQGVVNIITDLNMNRWLVLITIQIMYIGLGMFVDPVGMVVITVPILHPIMLDLGFDPIWFGVLLMINIEMALVTPPVGMAIYMLKGVVPKEIELTDIFSGAAIFVIADAFTLFLMMLFPEISLWLPRLMFT